MKDLGFSFDTGVMGQWPADSEGKPVRAVFLTHVSEISLEGQLLRNMLLAFGVPTVCSYPGNGELSKVIMGTHASGADIYVPETMEEDARNILNSKPENNTEEE